MNIQRSQNISAISILSATLEQRIQSLMSMNTSFNTINAITRFPETPYAFHPIDPPYGMRNYDLGCLSKEQKQGLNQLKIRQQKENEIYLNAHPEIRGLISILLRHLLKLKPLSNVHEVVGNFFNRPRYSIACELLDYMREVGYSADVINNVREDILKYDDRRFSSSEILVECD